MKPNVSWATDTNAVHYDKKPAPPETRIVATFKNDGAFAANIDIVGYVNGRNPHYVIDPIEAIEHDGTTMDMSRFTGSEMIEAKARETFKYTLKDDTTIANNQFAICNHMTSVTIPSCITSIGSEAFSGCTSLESITCKAKTPPTFTGKAPFSETNDCPIYVPALSIMRYRSAEGWSALSSRIQMITEDIPIMDTVADK